MYPNTLDNNNNMIWISLNKLHAAHAWDKMALYNGEHDDNLFEWGFGMVRLSHMKPRGSAVGVKLVYHLETELAVNS